MNNGNGNVDGNASMYRRLSQLHGHVHGNDDAVHEERQDGHEDDVHVHGLHGDVRNVRQRHDAHVSDERKDMHDVYGNVHDVRWHVRAHERQSDDDAVRRDVPAVRRVLLYDSEDDEGRLSLNRDAQQDSGAAHPAPGPVRKSPRRGYARAFREAEKSSTTTEAFPER
jgi:hypothetical protein